VKKSQNILSELFQVNSQAGYLRLIFFILLFFIIWSLLAVISAVYNPFANLNLIKISASSSSTLAVSLFRDILNAYLSSFTLSCLALILYIFYTSFKTNINLFCELKTFSLNKNNKDYLLNCAFSVPPLPKYHFPEDLIDLRANKSFSFPEGPLIADLMPGFALYIYRQGTFRTLVNSSDNKNLEISLSHQEKIIDCFNLKASNLEVVINNQNNDFFWPNTRVDLVYSYQLPFDDKVKNQLPWINLFKLCDSNNLSFIIENILTSVIMSTLTQNKLGLRDISPFPSNKSQDHKHIIKNNLTHNQSNHQMDVFLFRVKKSNEIHYLKRNRKRPIYIPPMIKTKNISKPEDKLNSLNIIDAFKQLLSINLRETMNFLFGAEIIKVEIINICEKVIK
jgi:hypothetical protein